MFQLSSVLSPTKNKGVIDSVKHTSLVSLDFLCSWSPNLILVRWLMISTIRRWSGDRERERGREGRERTIRMHTTIITQAHTKLTETRVTFLSLGILVVANGARAVPFTLLGTHSGNTNNFKHRYSDEIDEEACSWWSWAHLNGVLSLEGVCKQPAEFGKVIKLQLFKCQVNEWSTLTLSTALSLRWKLGEDICLFRGLLIFLAFLAANNEHIENPYVVTTISSVHIHSWFNYNR